MTSRDALADALRDATNGGNWRVRVGHGPDSSHPAGYRYVQFGPSERKADGHGTDNLAPEDARLIVMAVDFLRAALSEAIPEAGTLDEAWKAAEAALPEGDYDDETGHPSLIVETHLYTGPDHVEARAFLTSGYEHMVTASGPTPAAALRALAARLAAGEGR